MRTITARVQLEKKKRNLWSWVSRGLTPRRTETASRKVTLTLAFQLTVAHALGFLVSNSRILPTDLNTGTITSNHYEFLSFLLQSAWTADSSELDPILQFQSPWFLILYSSILISTQLSQTKSKLCYDRRSVGQSVLE
jgi:hypothetical protein